MPRSRLLYVAMLGVVVLVGPARTQGAVAQATVSEVPLPGGLRAALAAIGDPMPPDRAQFLPEVIRRTYGTLVDLNSDPRMVALRSLVAALDAAALSKSPSPDTLPLPLSDRIWIDVVFRGRATPQTLVSAILQSRSAALFYCGLLSLDDDTRAWLSDQRDLIEELASRRAAGFVVAAPGLRVAPGGVRPIGGAQAAPVWQALVGKPLEQPDDFVRALLSHDEGHLAYFWGALAQLTPAQIRVALNLDAPDLPSRIESARRLYAVFHHLWNGRTIEQGAFTHPALDPALLVAELATDATGRPLVPGTRRLWRAVFSGADPVTATSARDDDRGTPGSDTSIDFPWLCERVFAGATGDERRRYTMVLFASRRLGRVTPESTRDAVDAVRAAVAYPALTGALERAGVTDIASYAAAARRAATLLTINGDDRMVRAVAQFQGALALVTRTAMRGSLGPRPASALVSSLSAVPLSDRGEYEGRLAIWLKNWIDAEPTARAPGSSGTPLPEGTAEDVLARAAGPIEQRVLRVLAGPMVIEPPVVEWEGTRYRLDLAKAEALRLVGSLGESAGAYLSEAVAVAQTVNPPVPAPLTPDVLARQAQELAAFDQALAGNRAERSRGAFDDRYGDEVAALRRAAGAGDVQAAARLLPGLADDLLARGLMEMAYATALGPHDGLTISAADAARRHDFVQRLTFDRNAPWRLPLAGAGPDGRWRVAGSLLGLDVALADFSLVRVSSRPPARRPTLNDMDSRAFIDAVALVEPSSLTNADRDLIVAAIRRGRARLNAVRTVPEALALADEARLSGLRRTLLSWIVSFDPERVPVFLSPGELLWLGLGNIRVDALRPWGAPAGARLGCLCLELVDRRPWEMFAGRWQGGMMASAFPDLNLRLAELLNELRMPAALLAPVLTSATRDFIDGVTSRDPDDRRALVEFVQALGNDRVEQYLALLTTDGPLVPIGAATPDRGGDHAGTGGASRVFAR